LPAKSLLATEKTPSIHVEAIQVEDEAPQPLPDKIKSRLSHFSHTYLVVDDIDAAWLHPDEYPKIEDILSKLDTLNVRILVTSRTHYRKNQPRGRCAVELTEEEEDPNELHCGHRDFCLDDDDREHVVWWQCVACTEEEDDPRMVNTVCVACWRRGYGCDKPYVCVYPLISQGDQMVTNNSTVNNSKCPRIIPILLRKEDSLHRHAQPL